MKGIHSSIFVFLSFSCCCPCNVFSKLQTVGVLHSSALLFFVDISVDGFRSTAICIFPNFLNKYLCSHSFLFLACLTFKISALLAHFGVFVFGKFLVFVISQLGVLDSC